MTSVVEGLRLLFSYMSISNAMVCQQYRVNLEVDNKVSIHAPLESLHSVSFATCSRSCINGCECFSYNSQTKMCKLYTFDSLCNPSYMTVSEGGWRSYTIHGKDPGTILVYLCSIISALVCKYTFSTLDANVYSLLVCLFILDLSFFAQFFFFYNLMFSSYLT